MTYDNLKDEVLALGFADSVESEGRFLLASNRALRLLSMDFPRREQLRLYKEYYPPVRTYDALGQGGIALCASEAISFCYRMRDGAIYLGNRELCPDECCGIYRVRTSEDTTLSTAGDAKVFSIAVYSAEVPLSACECASPYVRYRIADYVSDLLCVEGLATDPYGREIEGARTEDGDVFLPFAYEGEFFVRYTRVSRQITKESEEIDIPERCIAIFPLLVCGYLWLDDEPERAQYYMALYREGRERLLRSVGSRAIRLDTDASGWT